MDFLSRFYFNYRRIIKTIQIYLLLAGPGLIVMIADNDAGGITTYAATGAKFGYNLIWFLILLGPVAYFVQEMTVRLGAVTKHGHAEAIFSAFGSFWGWFSLLDLSLVNWLTLVTEFIGMTAGLSIFGVPPVLTVLIVVTVMMAIVISGRYWTWEKITMVFCLVNLIYIPAAILVHPSVPDVIHNGLIPNFPGGFNGELFFFLMANIGTTIAPWMIFFQQSAVVDKQMKEKDIAWGKFDTAIGAVFTVLVAVFIIIVTGTLLHGMDVESAAQAAQIMMVTHPWVGTMLAIGLFDAGFLGALCIALTSVMGVWRGVRVGAFLKLQGKRGHLVLPFLLLRTGDRRFRCSYPGGSSRAHHAFCPGRGSNPAARRSGLFDHPPQQRGGHGEIQKYPL